MTFEEFSQEPLSAEQIKKLIKSAENKNENKCISGVVDVQYIKGVLTLIGSDIRNIIINVANYTPELRPVFINGYNVKGPCGIVIKEKINPMFMPKVVDNNLRLSATKYTTIKSLEGIPIVSGNRHITLSPVTIDVERLKGIKNKTLNGLVFGGSKIITYDDLPEYVGYLEIHDGKDVCIKYKSVNSAQFYECSISEIEIDVATWLTFNNCKFEDFNVFYNQEGLDSGVLIFNDCTMYDGSPITEDEMIKRIKIMKTATDETKDIFGDLL